MFYLLFFQFSLSRTVLCELATRGCPRICLRSSDVDGLSPIFKALASGIGGMKGDIAPVLSGGPRFLPILLFLGTKEVSASSLAAAGRCNVRLRAAKTSLKSAFEVFDSLYRCLSAARRGSSFCG